MKIKELYLALEGLCAYRALREEPIIATVVDLFYEIPHLKVGQDADDNQGIVGRLLQRYGHIFSLLREGGYSGIGEYLWDYLRYSPTLYGKMVVEGRSDPALENGARRELNTLITLAKWDCDALLGSLQPYISQEAQGVLVDLPRWSSHCPFDFESLTAFHKEQGYGEFAKHQYFSWRNDVLTPVTEVTTRPYQAMHGYRQQREQVLRNTMKLMAGERALHVLLYGDGGTGKSAVVKSMAWEFPTLRLIQADHNSLRSLPDLIGKLGKSPYPFLIFIDDLAFDTDDNTFSALKSILEGGLETPPGNVVVYATSNRRHLVRQTFSERAGEEVDMMETISEKTALSERFGIRIPYMSMNKAEYLDLVDYLYQERGLSGMDAETLHHSAMMWEIRRGGRTPRVAEQFIHSL